MNTGSTTLRALPKGFLFGASTSAHQIEGNNLASDFWHYENLVDSRLPERSGDACDSYNRWREDMDLLAELGFNAYRFGIEWARIEPEAGRVSAAQVQHYKRMVDYAHSVGLEPVLTLHHFSSPRWFTQLGGWGNVENIDRFLDYLDVIAPILGDGDGAVVTINEPNILAIMTHAFTGAGGSVGALGGGLPAVDQAIADVLITAHDAARQRLQRDHPRLHVGWSVANQVVQYVDGGRDNALQYRENREDQFLRASRQDDFVGVQAYTRTVFDAAGVLAPPSTVDRTLTGWEYYPEALGEAVRHTNEVTGGTPILVTENGIATTDDQQRIAYTTAALAGLAGAMDQGIDVRGYLHWSALDNYEWGRFAPTFGLIEVERNTFARSPKPSARWLGAMAREQVFRS